ncbi:unnamed protein product, partial [Ectocarpus sp. 12 AP-2014]
RFENTWPLFFVGVALTDKPATAALAPALARSTMIFGTCTRPSNPQRLASLLPSRALQAGQCTERKESSAPTARCLAKNKNNNQALISCLEPSSDSGEKQGCSMNVNHSLTSLTLPQQGYPLERRLGMR